MQQEQIVFVGTSELAGRFRAKSFPAAEIARLTGTDETNRQPTIRAR